MLIEKKTLTDGKKKRKHRPANLSIPDAARQESLLSTGLPGNTIGATALRPADISTWQRLVGNRAVQRMLASNAHMPLVQRRKPSAALDLLFPNFALELPSAVIKRVQGQIKKRKWQAALDILARALDDRHIIDLSVLDGNRIIYAPKEVKGSVTGAVTRATWVGYGKKWKLDKVQVFFSQRAMGDANMLYSALMHEWQHVRQGFDRGKPPSKVENLVDEFEAYCWQVDHAEGTGTYNKVHMTTTRQTLDFVIWSSLKRREVWNTFSERMKKYLTSRYKKTMKKIDAAPLKGP
jgi:hypothetical protein